MYREVTKCRMTGSSNLIPVLDLGTQYLTGVFPKEPTAALTKGPVELVLCPEGGLLQLRHSYEPSEMYGWNYGYRSGLNRSMVMHLEEKAAKLEALAAPAAGDVVLDIGSNDATLLKAYRSGGLRLGGIDPSAQKFKHFYPGNIGLITDFFSKSAFTELFGVSKAKIVTSIAMFYDLEDPIAFMRSVAEVLSDDGVWHFEQSYMPSMLETNSYDTVCQEHLEYYGLAQIMWMADRANLKIIDVELTNVNGGSFAVTAAKRNARYEANNGVIDGLMAREEALKLRSPRAYEAFRKATLRHREDLPALIRKLRDDGKKVFGYGASTKGNVILQFCGLTPEDLPCIADVNPDKHGCFTPGTNIPIVSEADAHARSPDYFLVLPWHFRTNLIARERQFLARGGKMIFPLPAIEIVGA
jgi:C-methyltransferase C-terminal domain/Putative zinc binding domain/Methyltransferase domain